MVRKRKEKGSWGEKARREKGEGEKRRGGKSMAKLKCGKESGKSVRGSEGTAKLRS